MKEQSKTLSVEQETFIPLEYAREKIRSMLVDWTKMKKEYLLALKETDERYKTTEKEHLVCGEIRQSQPVHLRILTTAIS